MADQVNGGALAAVSVAVSSSEEEHRELLGSIVEVARAILGARASSIFLLDEASGELVFEAVAGEGERFLVGRRMSAHRGIAGWVLSSGEPMVVDDLVGNAHFARDVAESTGFVPTSIIAVPLTHDELPLGVLEVLDRTPRPHLQLDDLTLLGLFARQAAVSLRVVQRNRAASRALVGAGTEFTDMVSVVRVLAGLGAQRRQAGLRLLSSLHEVLADAEGAAR